MLPLALVAAYCLTGQTVTVESLAFSPDGKLLVAGRADGRVAVYEVPGKQERFHLQASKQAILGVAFSPDGKLLVAGDASGQIHCWDVAAKKLLKRWQAHDDAVAAVAFVPGTKALLASGSYDSSISFWTLPEGRREKRWHLDAGRITALSFSADGKWLASGGTVGQTLNIRGTRIGTSGTAPVRLADVATGKAEMLKIHGDRVVMSPDGRFVAGGGMAADVRETTHGGGAVSIGIGGGKSMVIGNSDRISLLNRTDGPSQRDMPWRGHLVAIAPNGEWLVTGGANCRHCAPGMIGLTSRKDNRLTLWTLDDGERILRVPQEDATAIAVAPNSAVLAAGNAAGAVTFWDIAKEKKEPTLDPTEQFFPTDNAILLELQRDFEELLKTEPRAALVREAKGLIYRGNFVDGLAILRQHRPRAAIPLLLRAWVDWREGKKKLWWSINPEELAASWTILTGQSLDGTAPPRKVVEDVVRTWWRPNKAKIALELASYSEEQLRVIARAAGTVEWEQETWRREAALALADRIRDVMQEDPDRPTWWEADVHPRLLPFIVKELGRARAPFQPIEWKYLPLLHSLAQRAQQETLLHFGTDEQQPARVRIPCLWAYTLAAGKLPAPTVIALLRQEKRLEHRLALLLLLEHGTPDEVSQPLLAALADPHRQIRQAALLALRGPKPAAAVPVLRPMLLTSRPDQWPDTIVDALVSIRTREAQAALVAYLESTLEPTRAQHIADAIHALEAATGRHFLRATDENDEHYREAARRALKWWREQER